MQDIIQGLDAIRAQICPLLRILHKSGCVHALILKIVTHVELPPKFRIDNKRLRHIRDIYIECSWQ